MLPSFIFTSLGIRQWARADRFLKNAAKSPIFDPQMQLIVPSGVWLCKTKIKAKAETMNN
jgi:hypothetical protein